MRRTGAISRTTTENQHKSGRFSAEPPQILTSSAAEFRLSAALNDFDLDNFDFRNIDPILASKLLDEIKSGADVGPLIEKLKKNEMKKMVTFEDEANVVNKLKPDDVFM